MKFQDILLLGFKGLRDRKFRALLNVLSVVIGVASIIALVSQTAGVQASVLSTLQSLGPTSVLVMPRGSQFTLADVSKLYSVPGVEAVIPVISTRMTLYSVGQPTDVTIMGVDSEGLRTLLGEIKMLDGSVYEPTSAPLAVVGYKLAFPVSQGGSEAIFTGQPLVLEQQLTKGTRRLTFQVVGLLQSYGSTMTISIDDTIFLPLDATMKLLNRRTFNLLIVRAASVDEVSIISEFLTNIYGNSATIISVQQLTQVVSTIIGAFSALLGSIAAISLTVAGLGIMNIMLVTVLERTRVIGILKSIGFRDRDILTLFLSEAIITGAGGGLLGLLSGYGLAQILPSIVSRVMGSSSAQVSGMTPTGMGLAGGTFISSYTSVITPEIVIASLAVAILVSVAAGLYPAWRASKLDPIKALRYE